MTFGPKGLGSPALSFVSALTILAQIRPTQAGVACVYVCARGGKISVFFFLLLRVGGFFLAI